MCLDQDRSEDSISPRYLKQSTFSSWSALTSQVGQLLSSKVLIDKVTNHEQSRSLTITRMEPLPLRWQLPHGSKDGKVLSSAYIYFSPRDVQLLC